MFTIIGADGREYGPVAVAKVQEWMTGGRANLQTRARRAGETEWKTLGDFTEFVPATPPPVIAAPVTATAPAAPVPGDARAIAADLISRAAPLDVFECLARSWHLWTANLLPLVGATLLVIMLQIAMGFVPLLGAFAGLFLNGVFYGGLYYYYLGKVRGQPRDVGDVFAGFSRAFVPLMLTSLLISGFTVVLASIFFGPWFLLLIKTVAINHAPLPPLPAGGMLLGFMAGAVVLAYASVSWSFSFILVLDKGLGPWTAMEVSRRVVTKQWFRVFFVMFLGSFLAMLGFIGLFVGVVFTLPLMFGAVVYAYEGLCHFPENPAGGTDAGPAAPTVPPAS